MKKRVFSLFLCLILCLSLFPVQGFAQEELQPENAFADDLTESQIDDSEVIVEEPSESPAESTIAPSAGSIAEEPVNEATDAAEPEAAGEGMQDEEVLTSEPAYTGGEDAPEIQPDQPAAVSLHGSDGQKDSVTYRFVPEVSDTFRLCVTQLQLPADKALHVTVYRGEAAAAYNWLYGEENPNQSFSYFFEAGETYLLELSAESAVTCALLLTNQYNEDNLAVDNEWRWTQVQATPGEALSLAVQAQTVYGQPIYVWKYNDYSGAGWVTLEDEKESTLTLDPAKAGNYECHVYDVFGQESWVGFYVVVDNRLTVWSADNEYNKTVAYGGSVTLAVKASATVEGFTYTWSRYEPDGGDTLLDETGSSLLVDQITAPSRITCTVKDQFNNSDSIGFTISLDNGFSAYPKGGAERDTNLSVALQPDQAEAELEVIASADRGDLHYRWYKNSPYAEVENNNSSKLTVLNPTASGSWRDYYCRVSDDLGNGKEISFKFYVDSGLEVQRSGGSTITVSPGDSVTMEVAASVRIGELHYQWYSVEQGYYYSETEIEGATAPSYQVNNVSVTQNYVCRVTDDYGNSQSCSFRIRIENHFLAYPEGEDSYSGTKEINVEKGAAAVLAVVASADTGEIHYTWRRDGRVLEDQTAATLTVENVTEAQDYTCVVTDDFGNSENLYFSVRIENHFYAYAKGTAYTGRSLKVRPNESVTLEVDAHADVGELHYQWRDSNWRELPGETQAACTLSDLQKYGSYSCQVSDDFGHSASIWFYLSVENGFYAWAAGTQTNYQTVKTAAGAAVTLAVEAHANNGELHYEWYCDGQSLPDSDRASFTVDRVETATTYECQVRDDYNNTNWVDFEVSVENHLKARVKGQPNRSYTSIGTAMNADLVLEVEASSDDSQLTYQWYRAGDGPGNRILLENETGTSLRCSVTGQSNYLCVVSDRYQNTSSVSFEVYVENHFHAWCSNTGTIREVLYAERGKTVQLTAEASADSGNVFYSWSSSDSQAVDAAQTNSVTTAPVVRQAYYYCTVSDEYGNTETLEFEVRIRNRLTVTAASPVSQTVPYDGSASFSVTAEATEGTLSYDWYGSEVIEMNNTPNLQLDHIRRSGSYTCMVTDSFGSSESVTFSVSVDNGFKAYVTGKNPDTPDAAYGEVFVDRGAGATLSVTASAATGELTYEWRVYSPSMAYDGYYNRETIGNGPTLTIENVESAGQYQCYVTDSFGTTKVVTFAVSVQNHLSVFDRETHLGLVTKTVDPGTQVTMAVDAAADDMSGMEYRWFLMENTRGTQRVWNASGSSCTTPRLTESRVYYCQVTDKYGFGRVVRYELNVPEEEESSFSGYATVTRSLTLGDSISLNVYVDIKDGTSAGDYTVKAEFTNARGETTLYDGVLSAVAALQSDGSYKLVFNPAAKEMNNIISVEVFYRGRQASEAREFSVREYCEAYARRRADQEKVVNICKAILDYGAYAQLNFGYDTGNLANRNLSSGLVESTAVPETSYPSSGACTGISGATANLNLVSQFEMNAFFAPNGTVNKENYSFSVNGVPVEAVLSDGEYKVKKPGIVAKELGNTVDFKVTNKTDGTSFTFVDSPVAYLYRAYSRSNNINLVHLCSAIYLYNQAAIAFFSR